MKVIDKRLNKILIGVNLLEVEGSWSEDKIVI